MTGEKTRREPGRKVSSVSLKVHVGQITAPTEPALGGTRRFAYRICVMERTHAVGLGFLGLDPDYYKFSYTQYRGDHSCLRGCGEHIKCTV